MLLFYQSVVYHKLLERDSGLKTLDQLLQGPESSPRRYRTVAKMMREDLKDLEDDSLDHIARRMDDIRRRLDLGRAGPKVRKVEDGVIESLDKLIKKIEDEQQQQQQQQQAGNKLQSSKPAQDSKLDGRKRPGRRGEAEHRLARAAGAICRPRSAKKPSSKSAATCPPTTATSSNSISNASPPKEANETEG